MQVLNVWKVNEMNNQELEKKTMDAVQEILGEKNFVSAVDIFMKIGKLSQKDYEDWRRGKIPYLERVLQCNLSKASLVMKTYRKVAVQMNLKPSRTAYHQWGKKKGILLQFSKSGKSQIEDAYSTHYVRKG